MTEEVVNSAVNQGLTLIHFSQLNLSLFGQPAILCPICDES